MISCTSFGAIFPIFRRRVLFCCEIYILSCLLCSSLSPPFPQSHMGMFAEINIAGCTWQNIVRGAPTGMLIPVYGSCYCVSPSFPPPPHIISILCLQTTHYKLNSTQLTLYTAHCHRTLHTTHNTLQTSNCTLQTTQIQLQITQNAPKLFQN